ncbi:MAG: hypothetical protein IJ232_04675 [Lachnospiraceae bacterium]|nr:hypothetical protein [Lachnospiraceae bacterium]
MTEYRIIPIELGADLFYKEKKKQVEYRSSKAKKKEKVALDPFAAMFVGVGELKYETDEDGQKHISFNA